MPPRKKYKDRPNSTRNRLKKILSLWPKTEEGRKTKKKRFGKKIDDEIDEMFNATVFNSHLHLNAIERHRLVRKQVMADVRKLRAELNLIGELGEFIIRKMKGFI